MRIAIGADHGGYALKENLLEYLREEGFELIDFGTNSLSSVDYPDFAKLVGQAIQEKKADRGILICGSGVGVCIAANKMKGIYAGLCHDCYSASQGVEHDGMNLLCLGSRVIGEELARSLVDNFLKAEYLGDQPQGERFARRVNKVKAIENEG
ncbi:MAG TPA: ribose 5-phosphate isomerase B [Chloroflexi bacterium]|nr:MAG: ribose 5-phosphate isomerase B [Chloroflexota bacterium]HDD56141.1 ribose 5-phosphate isomerase B [Chloroflexota bacterium]